MSRPEAEMWAEAMAHIGHSADCTVCRGDFLWKPDDLNALLDAAFTRRVLSRPAYRREFERWVREGGRGAMPVPPELDPTMKP